MRTALTLLVGLALSLALDFSEVDVGLHNERGWVAAYADFNADKANDLLVVRDSGVGGCDEFELLSFISATRLRQQATKRTYCCGKEGYSYRPGPS